MDRPEGSGPIITETIYDTFPKRGGVNYEEPIYMPSNYSGVVPPNSSYKPESMSPEHYESYYDYRAYRSNPRGKKNTSASDTEDEDRHARYWSDYEAGAYRKASTNGGGIYGTTSTVPNKPNGQRPTPPKADETVNSPKATGSRDYGKPLTPPADYGSDPEDHTKHQNGATKAPTNGIGSGRQAPVY